MDENSQDVPSSPWWLRILVGRRPRWTLARVFILVLTCFVVFKFVLRPIRVTGISMEPTYHNGQINFVNRMAYRFAPPQRRDVISISITGESVMLMKRIIGLPGETLAIKAGVLLINGQPVAEPYVKNRLPWEIQEMQLKLDQYFVVGDNRGMDQHLHTGGVITRDRIVGKVLF